MLSFTGIGFCWVGMSDSITFHEFLNTFELVFTVLGDVRSWAFFHWLLRKFSGKERNSKFDFVLILILIYNYHWVQKEQKQPPLLSDQHKNHFHVCLCCSTFSSTKWSHRIIIFFFSCYSFIFLFLENYGVRKLEAVFAFLIATMAISFAWMFGEAKPSGVELLLGQNFSLLKSIYSIYLFFFFNIPSFWSFILPLCI